MDDELYQAPLDEFTAARDALAARLKASGDREGATQAKRARKPSVPAWAANQVVWQAREEWERLRAAAKALRSAHERPSSPEELRGVTVEQRDALAACESRAAEMLTTHGHGASPSVLQKVGHSLLALAHDAAGAKPGRLDRELQPPGFEALLGMSLADAPASSEAGSSIPTPRPRDPTASAAAEARLVESRRGANEARQRRDAAEKRRLDLERDLRAASRALEASQKALDDAEAEVKAAEDALAALRASRAGRTP